MGNASSNQQQQQQPQAQSSSSRAAARRTASPAARSPSAGSAGSTSSTSSPNNPHRSLRHKKRSLELPDLASLALSPSAGGSGAMTPGGTRRAGRTTSPIPIPMSPANAAAAAAAAPRAVRAVPSQADMAELLQLQAAPGAQRTTHFRGAPLPYSSTRSFRDAPAPPRPAQAARPIDKSLQVHATVDSGLPNPLQAAADGTARRRNRPEPVPYKVYWRGHAQQVVLARAGDNYWKGRQPMDKDPNKDVWSTTVNVLPGTHHVKFIVDDQWRISDDYHKAVADDGSLANYIAIPIPALGAPRPRAGTVGAPPANYSFWSGGDDDGSSLAGVAPGDPRGWTDTIPAALVHASAEEEAYLAAQEEHSQGGADYAPVAPNIPPAPALPRFLEKLILNTRPTGPTVAGRDRTAERHRNRARAEGAAHGGMPVTTASGTDISRPAFGMSPATPPAPSPAGSARRPPHMPRLDVNLPPPEPVTVRARAHSTAGAHTNPQIGSGAVHAVADDSSVLPVPSHVILHHLCTSAIRNGVLAVANTTRYRKKYLTTIYYKPT